MRSTAQGQPWQGRRRLKAAAEFSIEHADGETLTASLVGDVAAVGVELDAALAGLRHEPAITWQTTRLNGFIP